jgi:hypothetical protein
MFQSPYDPGVAQFGGGSSHTVMHPLVAAALIALILAVLLLPRKHIIVPLLLGLLIIPAGQNLYFAGLHFYTASILISFGCVRMLAAKFSSHAALLPGGFGTLDKIFVVWAIYRASAGVLQFMQAGAVPNQLALFFNAIGAYFLFRFLIRTDEDIARAIKVLAVVALFAAVSMVHEQRTLQNWFGQLGGIRPAPEVRNGRIRSQGFFRHALLAGSVGATLFPLFLWLFVRGKARILAALGAAAALVMVYTASTSTPLMAVAGAVLVICLWPLRKNMRLIRWGIVLGLVGLQLVMKAPFWFVMGHIDLAGGSTGWDRAMLIDNFLHHLGGWWLIGTHSNASWGWDMWDECNQFIAEGLGGGLVCLISFVAMFALCFKKLGQARKALAARRQQQWLIWLFAAALFAQAMAYFGIDYFDQSKYVWYLLLVMLGTTTAAAISSSVRKTKPAKVAAVEPDTMPALVEPAAIGRCAEVFSR